MKKIIWLILFCTLPFLSTAQLMDGKKKLTRNDTLRGMLSPARSCYDVTYYQLDVRLDMAKKRVIGNNMIRFKVTENFKMMQIDLFENMLIEKIVYKFQNIRFRRDGNAVFVEMPEVLKKGDIGEIAVFYYGSPIIAKRAPWDGGFVWTKDKEDNTWVTVACQGTGASLWWPCKDHQSDEPDSMLLKVTVPRGLYNVSNGRLRKTTVLRDSTIRQEWFISYPINTYNVTLNVGKYTLGRDTFVNSKSDSLTLDYYIMPYNAEKAGVQFEQVKPMLACFEKYFGPYPFYRDGFKLVETPYLGMEHQSAVAYGNGFKNGYLGTDLSGTGEGLKFDYIIIHETAHEWWGNSVTTADIADMWIHEGFGQYAEALYLECEYGKESSQKYLNGLKKNVDNTEPIIGTYNVNQEGSGDMYPKGALLLNTIRHVINNDSIWFAVIKGVATEFRHSITTSAAVEKYMSEKSGVDLSKIFKQYLRLKDLPILEVELTPEKTDLIVKYRWITEVTFFDMPMRITTSKGKYGWVTPDLQVKSMRLANMRVEDFRIDEKSFYIKSRVIGPR